ncbi:MAG TPA: dihydrolipoamide acetyltransferase family protein [Actinomycetota bacterium]|nr:dihydrolipoamide acetyltransferase family protein [Actinomycetota bacterium]
MGTEIKMPQLGETVVEGTITKWLKQEGDTVSEDELLVEISTDKVDSEVPSSASGVIEKILVQEGETVNVGTPLAVVGEGGSSGGDAGASQEQPDDASSDGPKQVPEDAPATDDQTDEAAMAATEQRQATGEGGEAQAEQEGAGAQPRERSDNSGNGSAAADDSRPAARASDADTSKRGIISPLVRRLADEHDVDLEGLEGTGTGGRIRKQDVLKFVETRKSRPQAKPAASAEEAPERAPERKEAPAQKEAAPAGARDVGEREELVPWSNIRRRTAEHMVASHLETARAWNAVEADWTNVVEVRGRAKGRFKDKEGFNLTFMPFLARAVCDTLLEMPEINASYDEENQANLIRRYVNLGIAVALEGGGLIVPVVKGADEKNLTGLARAINDVATRARTKKLSPDDLTGGTFTITNPGPFGSIMSVPIIPKGQTAILAFEAIQKRVIVTDDDSIAIRSMGFLPMSWDHRTIDGAEAAKFLARLRERIETTDWATDLAPYL